MVNLSLHPIYQVTVEYKFEEGACVPLRVHTVVISVQHNEDVTLEDLRKDLREKVISQVIPDKYLDERTVYHLQPSGKFIIGGPQVSFVRAIPELMVWGGGGGAQFLRKKHTTYQKKHVGPYHLYKFDPTGYK